MYFFIFPVVFSIVPYVSIVVKDYLYLREDINSPMKALRHFYIVQILLPLALSAQSPWVYGIEDHGDFSQAYLVRLNYMTAQYDTLLGLGSQWLDDFGSSIDPYNGRMFLRGLLVGEDGDLHIIDLNTLEIQSYYTQEGEDIEYDFLDNSIIFQEDTVFWKFDLESLDVNGLNNIPVALGSIWGDIRYFNPVENTYVYRAPLSNNQDNSPLIVLDASTGETKAITPTSYNFSSMVVDYESGKQYGKFNGKVFVFDPITGYVDELLTIPDYHAHLNQQMDVYDQYNKKYIVFYVATSDKEKLSVIDMVDYTIDTTYDQPSKWMDHQQIYSRPRTFLRLLNDTLVTSYGLNYDWYYNGYLNPFVHSQCHVPDAEGDYQTLVEYPQYESLSEVVTFLYTNIEGGQISNGISVLPNPFTNEIKLKIPDATTAEYYLIISNLVGDKVYQASINSSKTINLEILPPGLYVVNLLEKNKLIMKEKILKMNR